MLRLAFGCQTSPHRDHFKLSNHSDGRLPSTSGLSLLQSGLPLQDFDVKTIREMISAAAGPGLATAATVTRRHPGPLARRATVTAHRPGRSQAGNHNLADSDSDQCQPSTLLAQGGDHHDTT